MAFSAFGDKAQEPRKPELESVLGTAGGAWDQTVRKLGSAFEPLTEDWVFSGKKWGWALRLKHKKRAVVYLTPCEGSFYAGFALGKKAVNAARESDLPEDVLQTIESAQVYAEGRGLRMEVRNSDDVGNVIGIAAIKMAN